MTVRTLIVAERANATASPRFYVPARWYRMSLRLGCFHTGESRARLESVGLTCADSLNLTPPAPQGVKWDRTYARAVAEVVRTDRRWDRIVALGNRAAQALRLDRRARGDLQENRFVCVPHPSGLCRFWNDHFEVRLLAALVRRSLSDLADSCRCAVSMCGQPCVEEDFCELCQKFVCPRCQPLHSMVSCAPITLVGENT